MRTLVVSLISILILISATSILSAQYYSPARISPYNYLVESARFIFSFIVYFSFLFISYSVSIYFILFFSYLFLLLYHTIYLFYIYLLYYLYYG